MMYHIKIPEPHCPHGHGKLKTVLLNHAKLAVETPVYMCKTCNEIASYTLLQRVYTEGYKRGELDRKAIVTEREELSAKIAELEGEIERLKEETKAENEE